MRSNNGKDKSRSNMHDPTLRSRTEPAHETLAALAFIAREGTIGSPHGVLRLSERFRLLSNALQARMLSLCFHDLPVLRSASHLAIIYLT